MIYCKNELLMLIGLLAYLPLSYKIRKDCIYQAKVSTNSDNTTISLQHACDFDAGVSVSLMSGSMLIKQEWYDFSLKTKEIFIGLPISIDNNSISLLIQDIGYYAFFLIQEAYKLEMDWDKCLEIRDLDFSNNMCFQVVLCSQADPYASTLIQQVVLQIYHKGEVVYSDQQSGFCFPITSELGAVLRLTPLAYRLEVVGAYVGQPTRLMRERYTYEILQLDDFQDIKLFFQGDYCLLVATLDGVVADAYDGFDDYYVHLLLEDQSIVSSISVPGVARNMIVKIPVDPGLSREQKFIVKLSAYRGNNIAMSLSALLPRHDSCHNYGSSLRVQPNYSTMLLGNKECSPALGWGVEKAEIYANGTFIVNATVEYPATNEARLYLARHVKLNNFESIIVVFVDADENPYDVMHLSDIHTTGEYRIKTAIHITCGVISILSGIAILLIATFFWRHEKFDVICAK